MRNRVFLLHICRNIFPFIEVCIKLVKGVLKMNFSGSGLSNDLYESITSIGERYILINIKESSNISLGTTRQQRLKDLNKEYLINQIP